MDQRFSNFIDESEFYQAVREKRTMDIHYYANACHVCRKYGETVNLKRCSSCKMIAYCSREHQKDHWPKHKQFCQIIGELNKEAGSSVLDWRNKMVPNKESWWQFRINLLNKVRLKLGRKVLYSEMEMILLPRACLVCHDIDADRLVNCSNCPTTTFCIKHAYPDHKRRCETSRLSFELDTAPYKMFHLSPHVNIGAEIPKDMEDVTRIYKRTYNLDETDESLRRGLIHFSDVLTRPYTIFYALQKLSFSRSRMNLHVVGADEIEERTVKYWEVLLHHFESLKHLDITLIGPNLQTENSFSIKLCESCSAKKATMLIKIIGKMYHDYANSDEFTKPNIIGGFNLGMHEVPETRDTWPLSIKEMEKQHCPFFMTSYAYREQKTDEKMINNTINREVEIVYSDQNPFCSLRPGSNFETEDFFYCNGYLTVYERL